MLFLVFFYYFLFSQLESTFTFNSLNIFFHGGMWLINSLNQTSTLTVFLGTNEELFMFFFFFLSEYSYLVNTSSVSQFNDIIDVYQFFSFLVNVK